MTVEEVKLQAKANGGHGAKDQFPVGMRVLAVDDDPTCLMVLENLLQRCQYQGMACSSPLFPSHVSHLYVWIPAPLIELYLRWRFFLFCMIWFLLDLVLLFA
jgi:CheY-like chemotaxis protein